MQSIHYTIYKRYLIPLLLVALVPINSLCMEEAKNNSENDQLVKKVIEQITKTFEANFCTKEGFVAGSIFNELYSKGYKQFTSEEIQSISNNTNLHRVSAGSRLYKKKWAAKIASSIIAGTANDLVKEINNTLTTTSYSPVACNKDCSLNECSAEGGCRDLSHKNKYPLTLIGQKALLVLSINVNLYQKQYPAICDLYSATEKNRILYCYTAPAVLLGVGAYAAYRLISTQYHPTSIKLSDIGAGLAVAYLGLRMAIFNRIRHNQAIRNADTVGIEHYINTTRAYHDTNQRIRLQEDTTSSSYMVSKWCTIEPVMTSIDSSCNNANNNYLTDYPILIDELVGISADLPKLSWIQKLVAVFWI
jgi:hypothetical protein